MVCRFAGSVGARIIYSASMRARLFSSPRCRARADKTRGALAPSTRRAARQRARKTRALCNAPCGISRCVSLRALRAWDGRHASCGVVGAPRGAPNNAPQRATPCAQRRARARATCSARSAYAANNGARGARARACCGTRALTRSRARAPARAAACVAAPRVVIARDAH